jgi:phosphatidate cytidylyltransferase
MLKQRVITALVLMALLVPSLLVASPWPFALLCVVLMAGAAWEWAQLNGGAAISLGLAAALIALCGAALVFGWADRAPAPLWWAGVMVWVLGVGWLLRAGVEAWGGHAKSLRWLFGLLLLCLAWLAILNARKVGINFMLSVFCIVWMADIAAYFGGRAFGRRKLAPAISPGKSWEGVWSGMLGVSALALAWLYVDRTFGVDSPSVFSALLGRFGWFGALLVVMFLCALSVVGDLFESLIKRSAGAKDSSRLLPGHGGVLDRFDALLPVVPAALAFVSL